MKKEFALFSKNIIVIEKKNNSSVKTQHEFIINNLCELGFTLDDTIINVLSSYNEVDLNEFYKDIIAVIIEKLRTDLFHQPMYPNFPKQVMEAHINELNINAIIHYICKGAIFPRYEKQIRAQLADKNRLKVLSLGTTKDLENMFINLVNAKTSTSIEDKEFIEFFIEENKELAIKHLPDEIYMRENNAFIMSLILKNIVFCEKIIKKYTKTAIDALRLATALSNGDISLKENTKFVSFNRRERRLLLSILEDANNVDDMMMYKNRFIRLGERLHPGEYKDKFPKCYEAFRKIRNNVKVETFNGRVEKAVLNNDIVLAVDLLKTRPSLFARNIDRLLRVNTETEYILENFKLVAEDVSSTILLQMREHFIHRCEERELRVFFPKGNVCNLYGIDKNYRKEKKTSKLNCNIFENLEAKNVGELTKMLSTASGKKVNYDSGNCGVNNYGAIDAEVCKTVVEICTKALSNIYSSKKPLGKVYLDEELKKFIVPFSQRSASKALKTIVRGSRLKIDDIGDTVRFFLYWREPEKQRVDIDLSAVIYDESWGKKGDIAYYNLRSREFNCAHSGDIVSAPSGASEFIDIDMKTVKKYGGRYIAFSINAFTQTMFCDLPECFAGWMIREYSHSGEIYEPRTVANKFDIASSATICLPMIMDLETREIIWTDITLKNANILNNVSENNRGMVLMGKALTNVVKPNLYDLFYINAMSRGTIVENKEDADTVFSLSEGITPLHIDEIVSNYL